MVTALWHKQNHIICKKQSSYSEDPSLDSHEVGEVPAYSLSVQFSFTVWILRAAALPKRTFKACWKAGRAAHILPFTVNNKTVQHTHTHRWRAKRKCIKLNEKINHDWRMRGTRRPFQTDRQQKESCDLTRLLHPMSFLLSILQRSTRGCTHLHIHTKTSKRITTHVSLKNRKSKTLALY